MITQELYRPMSDISLEERREILTDYSMMKAREVREKWHITNSTLGHIRFQHGGSSAKAKGYYHKNLTDGIVDPRIEKLKLLKDEGKNSLEASEACGIPLEQVNKLWPTLNQNHDQKLS